MPTVRKRGNSYLLKAYEGYTADGKQIVHTKTWNPPAGMSPAKARKEAMKAAVLFEQQMHNELVLSSSIKFEEFAQRFFLDYGNTNLRPRTLHGYKQLMPRINAAIGHIRMDKLKPTHLTAFYKQLATAGVRADGKAVPCADIKQAAKDAGFTQKQLAEQTGLSIGTLREAYNGRAIAQESAAQLSKALQIPVKQLFTCPQSTKALGASTIRKYHSVISSILTKAVKWQVIVSNPAERAELPKPEPKEAVYLDEIQTAHLLQLMEKETEVHRVMVSLLIFTGMRRAELCGLEWSDIDFEHALIHIQRTSQYIPKQGVIEDLTKNSSSQRAVAVSASVLSMLRVYKAHQAEQRLKLGSAWNPAWVEHPRLFTQLDGTPINPDSVTKWFHAFIARSDLPPIHIHSLRHTNATLQIAGGVPLTTVADRLGHATPATTTKVYSHAIQSANAAAADTLERMLRTKQA